MLLHTSQHKASRDALLRFLLLQRRNNVGRESGVASCIPGKVHLCRLSLKEKVRTVLFSSTAVLMNAQTNTYFEVLVGVEDALRESKRRQTFIYRMIARKDSRACPSSINRNVKYFKPKHEILKKKNSLRRCSCKRNLHLNGHFFT